ncbi:ABC transporter substrate-binding protein [Tissierellaceae bacterium HCP3S3_D8]
MKLKSKDILILMLVGIMLLSGCSTPVEEKEILANNDDGNGYKLETLKLEGGRDWGMSNPFLQDPRGPGTGKVKLVFDSLLEADENGIIAWLAKEWNIDENIYTFKICENAYFHDGKPVTTEDIGFSIDYYREYPPINNVLGSKEQSIVKSYEVVDNTTIKIEVKEVYADTLTKLGSFLILPKHIWENIDDPYTYTEDDAFIGSGPYRWSQYDSATGSYEFIAFDKYYGLKPVTERILFVPVSDSILAFENKEIDITDVPADLVDKYREDSNIGMISKDNDMGYKLLINMEKLPEFKDLEMRKFIYNGINRQGIVDKVFRGLGSVGSAGYVPVTNRFYNPEVVEYEYSLEEAKKILGDIDIDVELLSSNSDKDIKISELIKSDLEAAGMKINVLATDGKVRDEKVFDGDYEFALVGNGGWGRTPDYLRTLYSSKSKFTVKNPHGMGALGYDNELITELAEKQLYELDFNERMEIFKELQLEISKEIPIVVLATESSNVMFRKDYYNGWTKTYDYQQLEQNRLSYVEK